MEPSYPEVSPLELAEKYEILGVNDGVVVVTELPASMQMNLQQTTVPLDIRELGTTGITSYGSIFREEYNPEMRGTIGMEKYDKMRRSDAQVRASLKLVKIPVLSARWFIEPASEKKKDKKIADFIWKCLTKYMSMSWPQMLQEAMLMFDFGYYMFEKVYDIKTINGKQMVVWKKLAPRHPMDVWGWYYDNNGGPVGVDLYAPNGSSDSVFLPIEKMIVFSYDKEAGNMEGISGLRSAYKHWFYKENLYKIDAIQKERHGIGIPVVKLPPGYRTQDKNLANELGRNLRTNEKAHVVLPPLWDLMMLKMEGQPVDCMKSIDHHNKMIMMNILAPFFDNGQNTNQEDMEFFLKGTRFMAEVIRDCFNKYAIPELVNYNFDGVTEYPELKVRRLGDTTDWRTMSFAIRNLVGAKVIIPDEALEVAIREEMDLTQMDKETQREVATPQLPSGPPRQSTAAKSQQGKTPGKSNTGQDNSGG